MGQNPPACQGATTTILFLLLCRNLCRNPASPTGVELPRGVSLRHRSEAGKVRRTRMNTASLCRLYSFNVGAI